MFDCTHSPSNRAAVRNALDHAVSTVHANIAHLRKGAAQAFARVSSYADRRVSAALVRRIKPSIVATTVLAGIAVALALISMSRK